MAIEAFFLPAGDGQRFCVLHRPDSGQPIRGAVLHVHPFAEEMNKARRMAALQARAMAAAGYVVLRVDLQGCGDSSGDFGDASWSGWIDDVVLACEWLRGETGADPWLWGLRSGCLLCCEVAQRINLPQLLFWQPALSGKQFLQQFLRLRVASDMLGGESKGLMEQMRRDLAAGQQVEVAGYALTFPLADGLEKAELRLPEQPARVEWIEISGKPEATLSPAATMRLEKWSAEGHAARGQVVCGPSFWQTAEIEECPALIGASLAAMENRSDQ